MGPNKHSSTATGWPKQQQQQHSLFSQASWGRLEMKPERNKFKVTGWPKEKEKK